MGSRLQAQDTVALSVQMAAGYCSSQMVRTSVGTGWESKEENEKGRGGGAAIYRNGGSRWGSPNQDPLSFPLSPSVPGIGQAHWHC